MYMVRIPVASYYLIISTSFLASEERDLKRRTSLSQDHALGEQSTKRQRLDDRNTFRSTTDQET